MTPKPCAERRYLKHRAEQEVWMTLHSDGLEAEFAHNELVGHYLKACVCCTDDVSAECIGCPLRSVCDRDIKQGAAVDADFDCDICH